MSTLQILHVGQLRVLSNHPVLDQVARDIVAGLDPADLPDRKITLFLGLHRKFGRHALCRGLRIMVQTEHYFDADGRAMWRRIKGWRTFKAALLNHHILDLSAANRPHYDALPLWLRRKVAFGPHIFPSHPPAFQPSPDAPFLFAGSLNDRRQALLDALPPGAAVTVPDGTFGAALDDLLTRAGGVLNLHYTDGRYSEMPRLLSAHLAGKAVMSEPLGPEVEMGRDYAPLGAPPSQAEAEVLHTNFWHHFARHHRLSAYLRALVPDRGSLATQRAKPHSSP